jgi:undecaprenyl-phosphate glucose phosphotransferase
MQMAIEADSRTVAAMLRNRQEGLATLHAIWVTVLVSLLFISYAGLMQATGWIQILDTANLNLYFVAAFGATLAGLRNYHAWGRKLLHMSWIQSILLTKQQILKLALVLFALAFVTKDSNVSRLFIGSFLCLAFGLLVVCNYYLPPMLCRLAFKASTVPTLFIGGPQAVGRLTRWAKEKVNLGVETVGLMTDAPGEGDACPGIPVLGGVAEVDRVLSEKAIGQVIIVKNDLTTEQIQQVVDACLRFGWRLRIYTNLEREYNHPVVVDHEGEYTFVTLEDEPLENPINRFIKRAFDVAFSLPVVLFALPPIALLVWIFQRNQSPGPIFFKQLRTGMTRQQFKIIKFRTMYHCEQDLATEGQQATVGDSRIYPFGEFLRKTSLDELPQFINVLIGDMSVAGPRPHFIAHDREFSRLLRAYSTRHFVKPGITGLAQCKGFRGEISELRLLRERFKYDVFYINNWSLLLDLQIILATVRQVFFPPKSAY